MQKPQTGAAFPVVRSGANIDHTLVDCGAFFEAQSLPQSQHLEHSCAVFGKRVWFSAAISSRTSFACSIQLGLVHSYQIAPCDFESVLEAWEIYLLQNPHDSPIPPKPLFRRH
jgi:hypothetical protein